MKKFVKSLGFKKIDKKSKFEFKNDICEITFEISYSYSRMKYFNIEYINNNLNTYRVFNTIVESEAINFIKEIPIIRNIIRKNIINDLLNE